MLYTTLTVAEKDYKLRLNAKNAVDLEKKLGSNPVNIFTSISIDKNKMPDLETLILIFHYSLQEYNHGFTLDRAYELYDNMVDEGKDFTDLLAVIVEVFQVSGLLPKDMGEDEKN